MFIVKIQGGLGNQLLQYAVGRVLEKKYKIPVKYDISFYTENTKYTKRPYLLDRFHTKITHASQEEIQSVRYPYGFFSKLNAYSYRFINKFFLKRYYIGYTPSFFKKASRQKSGYFEGYWQSYKYYEHFLPELSREITLCDVSSIEVFKKDTSFFAVNSVSVHVRRGDFLNPQAGTKVIPRIYYEEAVKVLEKKVENPVYYIFSDDIEWVKKEMGDLFTKTVYVSSRGLKDYEEFALLKECKHAILSNSTFCWFATLLTDKVEKVVFYPKDWQNAFLNNSTHICPEHWNGV